MKKFNGLSAEDSIEMDTAQTQALYSMLSREADKHSKWSQILTEETVKEFEEENVTAAAIIGKRFLAVNAVVTNAVALFGPFVCHNPGQSIIYVIDILDTLGIGTIEHPITLRNVAEYVYPHGARKISSYQTRLDEIKQYGKEVTDYGFLY